MIFKGKEKETGLYPQHDHKRSLYATACATLASTSSIIVGYNIGVMNGAANFIKDDLKLSSVQLEILMGSLSLSSLLAFIVTGNTSDKIGRRFTIALAGCFFFLGAMLTAFATNYAIIMVGRFVSAIGVGYAIVIAPIYAAEIAPDASRGILSSFPEIFFNFGILLGYVSNYAFSKLNRGWRLMLGIPAIASVFLVLGALAIPESPQWLVLHGRLADAMKVLEKTSDTRDRATSRLDDIKRAVEIPDDMHGHNIETPTNKSQGKSVWKELLINPTPAVRHVLIACLGVHFFQQASGVDAIVLFTPTIFTKAGMIVKEYQLLTTITVGAVKTVFTIIGACFIDRFGRRALLLTSMGGMFLSLVTLGSSLAMIEEIPGEKAEWAIHLSLTTVMLYMATYSIGVGPVTWVYCSEIFPMKLRAQGVSLGVMLNRVTSGIISISFMSLSHAISVGATFQLFALISLVGWFFFFNVLPETRGKPLEEMETLFGSIASPEKNLAASKEIDSW